VSLVRPGRTSPAALLQQPGRRSNQLRWPCRARAPQAVPCEGRLIINPGSATGAYSTLTKGVNPSFVLMDLDGRKVGCWAAGLCCCAALAWGCSRALLVWRAGGWAGLGWHWRRLWALAARPQMPRHSASPILPNRAPPRQATVYVYHLKEGEVKVDKIEYEKPAAAAA
jgi:hypothetical protein